MLYLLSLLCIASDAAIIQPALDSLWRIRQFPRDQSNESQHIFRTIVIFVMRAAVTKNCARLEFGRVAWPADHCQHTATALNRKKSWLDSHPSFHELPKSFRLQMLRRVVCASLGSSVPQLGVWELPDCPHAVQWLYFPRPACVVMCFFMQKGKQ